MGGLDVIRRRLLIFSILLSLTPPSASTSQTNTFIELGKSLADGSILSSAGGTFHLGFFSLDGSSDRYVGIWHGRFSPDNVVWVANRDSPIPRSTASLAIAADGNLVVVDDHNEFVWSTNATFPSNDSTAELTDYGDLVVNNSGATAWESFAHPTNTYLPGMKVGLRLDPNSNQVLTSGNFSLGVDPSSQLFMWESGRPRWRSGPWNGQVFVGIPGMMFPAAYGFTLSNFIQGNTVYYYTSHNSSHRWILTPAGTVKHLVFFESNKTWLNFWEAPITECDEYNKCGKFGICADDSTPICSCLKGFTAKSSREWNSGNWTGGCVRTTRLECESRRMTDKFYQLQGVKLPDLEDRVTEREVVNLSSCQEVCLENCSCRAYTFLDAIGCMIWAVDLVDITVFSAGGYDLYLRLAPGEFSQDNKKKKALAAYVTVIIVLVGVFLLGFMSFLLWKWKGRTKEVHRPAQNIEELGQSSNAIELQDEGNQGKSRELPLFGFSIVEAATGGFSELNFLGKGGFGSVYKGKLPGGQEIAVKRLSRGSRQGLEEFKNEVMVIAKLQHRNLVRLLGFCTEKEDQMLIYEYMPNKSLDAFLFESSKRALLDWKTRYRIIEGIARGLLYLHRDSRLRIIHRDLKASNILLDEEMNPKISDFGLAKIFRNDSNETTTDRVVGTYGYMSPEYAMQGLFSVKSDVYSFGVLLLEIVSGKRNSSYNSPADLYLLAFAWKLWIEENMIELVDPEIRDSCPYHEVSSCINVGLLCVQDRATERPSMSSVVMMLETGIIRAQPVPKRPTFAIATNLTDSKSHSSDAGISSNNASITVLVGR
ncbi:G-type lectin S-receptor-like serine/threonine-protein kinase B120 [Platanthera zijinensis]|uniref:Receptor-like serine/threonine-protein kinase n=1 Tax=Platanthera zijinensis TaxID=2320716 RepID=A0AAP0B7B8_9ASPA